ATRLGALAPTADGEHDEFVREEVRAPELVERRDDLAVGEIAGGTEQDQGAGVRDALEAEPFAKGVVLLLRRRLSLALPGDPQVLHRPRRVLRPGRGVRGLVGRGL